MHPDAPAHSAADGGADVALTGLVRDYPQRSSGSDTHRLKRANPPLTVWFSSARRSAYSG